MAAGAEEAKKEEEAERKAAEKAAKKAAKLAAKQRIEDLKLEEAAYYKKKALDAGLPEPTGIFGSEGLPKAVAKLFN